MLFTPQNLGGNEMGTAPPGSWILGGNKLLPPQGLRFWGGNDFLQKLFPPKFFRSPPGFWGGTPPFWGVNPKIRSPPSVWGVNFRQIGNLKTHVSKLGGGTAPPSLWDLGGKLPPQASEIWGGNIDFPP